MKNALHFPYAFVLMNWAAVVGFYCFVRRGNTIGQDIWTTLHHSHNHEPQQYSMENNPLWAHTQPLS